MQPKHGSAAGASAMLRRVARHQNPGPLVRAKLAPGAAEIIA